jgi:protein-S-isoprenylcysteine O-methyltransferase Ste14
MQGGDKKVTKRNPWPTIAQIVVLLAVFIGVAAPLVRQKVHQGDYAEAIGSVIGALIGVVLVLGIFKLARWWLARWRRWAVRF